MTERRIVRDPPGTLLGALAAAARSNTVALGLQLRVRAGLLKVLFCVTLDAPARATRERDLPGAAAGNRGRP